MAYDEGVAHRVGEALAGLNVAIEEKKMFGGVGYMLDGNMACGVHGDRLIVRVGPEGYAGALARPHVREFDLTGRAMKGWITVGPAGYESERDLAGWIERGLRFAASLPPK
jgi:TfoX/Sxy family transcriptional regulator of competence genes